MSTLKKEPGLEYFWVLYSVFLHSLQYFQVVSSSNEDLDYFAYASNKMIPTKHVTVLSSFNGTLPQCARACREFRQPLNLTGTGNRGLTGNGNEIPTCQAFEYVDRASFCILFDTRETLSGGLGSLCPATGTTYFELTKSNSILSLFVRTPKHVLFEDTAYYDIANSTSVPDCAQICLDSPDVKCKSFAYSTTKKLCAFSKYTNSTNHTLMAAEKYDFYRYRNDWPCNVTFGWKYEPKIIVSDRYPFVPDKPYDCFFNIIPPKEKHVVIRIMALLSLRSLCEDPDAGIFVYGGQNGTIRICEEVTETPIENDFEDGSFVTILISQRKIPFVTRVHYKFDGDNLCKELKCLHGGTCKIINADAVCLCPKWFAGKRCEIDNSVCSRSPCLFGGRCASNGTGYHCRCLPGTTGTNCEIFIGKCYTTPCRNGNCTPTATKIGFQCACAPGFTGSTCEYEINECFSSPCVNGECKDVVNGYKCLCNKGFEGLNCEIKTGEYECKRRNCKFGTCALNISGSYCQCFPGFSGKFCDVNINECESSPCVHGACIDHVNAYVCNCSIGYMGKRCNILLNNPCKYNPCKHGYCSINNDGYTCICYGSFTGRLCNEIITSNLTSKLTTFTTKAHPLSISSTIPFISTGKTLKTLVPESTTTVNRLSTSTINTPSSLFTEADIHNTSLHPSASLLHTDLMSCTEFTKCSAETCEKIGNQTRCVCLDDFTGSWCVSKLTKCNHSWCINGACVSGKILTQNTDASGDNASFCVCFPRFEGKNCDQNGTKPLVGKISPAAVATTVEVTTSTDSSSTVCNHRNACQNNGVCLRVGNTFQCVCKNLYTGDHCEFETSTQTPAFQTSSVAQFSVLNTRIPDKTGLSTAASQSAYVYNKMTTATVVETTNTHIGTYKVSIPEIIFGEIVTTKYVKSTKTVNPGGFWRSVTEQTKPQVGTDSTSMLSETGATKYMESTKTANPDVLWRSVTEKSKTLVDTDSMSMLSETGTTKYMKSTKTANPDGLWISVTENPKAKVDTDSMSMFSETGTTKLRKSTKIVNPYEIWNGETETVTQLTTHDPTQGNIKTTTNTAGGLEHRTEYMSGTTPGANDMSATTKHANNFVINETAGNKKYHGYNATDRSVRNNSLATPKFDELSRKTFAPEKTTTTATGQKPLDNASNHVITLESALIGGLIVALLVVSCVAILLCYKRNRSGTVYISSSLDGRKLDNTSVKKRFSSRDIYMEQMKGRRYNPYCTQSIVTENRVAPSRKEDSVSSQNSSKDRSSSPSSNSSVGQYEPVQTKSPMTCRSQSEESSCSSDKNCGCQNRNVSYDNYQTPEYTGSKPPSLPRGIIQKPRPSIDPLYQKEDGSYGLNLNREKNVSPAEFQRALDELITSDKHKYTRHFTSRKPVHQIDGVEYGKSEA